MYSIILKAPGNPDHMQFADVAEPLSVECAFLHQLRRAANKYIREHNLGSGNFDPGVIYKDGEPWGKLSYNGRVERLDGSTVASGIPSELKGKLMNALTEYDRRQAKRPGYNQYALGHYAKAMEKVHNNVERGYTLRVCLLACFTGRLCDILLKAAGLAPMSREEARGGVSTLPD